MRTASLKLDERLVQGYGIARPSPARRQAPRVLRSVSKCTKAPFKCILQTFDGSKMHKFEKMLCCSEDQVRRGNPERSTVFHQ